MSRALDRRRPFGEVYGGGGHKYEQDGLKFDHDGSLIGQEPEGVVEVPAPAPAPAASNDPAAAALAAGQAKMAERAAKMLDQSIEKIVAEFDDLDTDMLQALRAGEEAGKTRVMLIRALDTEIAKRAPAVDQVSAQLGA